MKRLTSFAIPLLLLAAVPSASAQTAEWWGPETMRSARTSSGQDDRVVQRSRRGRTDGDVRTRRSRRTQEEVRTRRQEDVVFGRRGDVYEDRKGKGKGKGNGPKFCRSGAGHPVHGMQWCYEKGYGDGYRINRPVWGRSDRDGVIFRRDRTQRGTLRRGTLGDILGDVVLGRMERQSRMLGSRAPLEGRWVPTERGRVLQVRSGSLPLAELADFDGDRRVDLMLLNTGR